MVFSLPFMEPIHVVGSGSIGLFFSSSIRSAFPSYPLAVLFRGHHKTSKLFASKENEIVVCTRQHRTSQTISKYNEGIVIRQRTPRPHIARVPYQFIGDDGANNRSKIRNLVLCTKAYQAESAIRGVHSRLDESNLRIMVLCNGALDVRERLIRTLQDRPASPELVMCTTTHGVVLETSLTGAEDNDGEAQNDDDMFHLLHVGLGQTYIGGNPTIAQLWNQSGLATQSIPPAEMEVLLWKKLAANCICNPLTALWGVPNGELKENASFATLRTQIVEEVSLVGTSLHPEMGDLLSTASLDSFVEQVIQSNLQNMSSMYYDVQRGRRTEVDNLNGYIVRKSKEMGLNSSANEEVLGSVKAISRTFE